MYINLSAIPVCSSLGPLSIIQQYNIVLISDPDSYDLCVEHNQGEDGQDHTERCGGDNYRGGDAHVLLPYL